MRTDKQKQTSKSNGNKSKGPITDAGKAKSSKNATTHGFSTTGHIVLLHNEYPNEFDAYSNAFFARFQPIDMVESDLVRQMICAVWRLRRMDAAETAIIDIEIDEQSPKIDEIFEQIDSIGRNALAIRYLAEKSNSLDLFTRYRTQARRSFTTALKTLQLLQGSRFNASTPLDPNQPQTSITTPAAGPAPESDPQSASQSEQPAMPSAHAPRTVSFTRKPAPNQQLPSEPEAAPSTGRLLQFRAVGTPQS